jgi:hypothetical protein
MPWLQLLIHVPFFSMVLSPDRSILLKATNPSEACTSRSLNSMDTDVNLTGDEDAEHELRQGATWEVDEVAAQLRDLFLELQFGPCAQADPTAFARCLQLDHGVQQVRMFHTLTSCTYPMSRVQGILHHNT